MVGVVKTKCLDFCYVSETVTLEEAQNLLKHLPDSDSGEDSFYQTR
jgi:hypothetical protein